MAGSGSHLQQVPMKRFGSVPESRQPGRIAGLRPDCPFLGLGSFGKAPVRGRDGSVPREERNACLHGLPKLDGRIVVFS